MCTCVTCDLAERQFVIITDKDSAHYGKVGLVVDHGNRTPGCKKIVRFLPSWLQDGVVIDAGWDDEADEDSFNHGQYHII